MKSSKTIITGFFLAGSTVLAGALPFLPLPEDPGTGLLVFIGRFHPLLLHFPIVLVLLTLILESLNIYQSKTQKIAGDSGSRTFDFLIGPLLLVSAVSALITLIGGYLLFRSGDYQGELVYNHLWGAVWLMVALNGASFFYWHSGKSKSKGSKLIYRTLLLTAGALIIFTSHLGGSITHGMDFLTEHMPTLQAPKPAPVEQKPTHALLVFQDLIKPVLEDKCQSCHNPYKVKGGLRMTSFADIQKGGKSEKPLLVPFNLQESELYHRITLPAEDEDKMPPPEKAPLEEDEVTLIKWWIESGASEEMVVGMEPPDTMAALVQRFLPNLYQSERLKMRQQEELDELAHELSDFGEKLGLVIKIDPEHPGYFGVSMQMPPAPVDNQTIGELKPYAMLFSKISLPGAEVDDDALFDIGKMSNLRTLYLPKTAVKGQGLVYLKSLDQLESINLSNSCLTNDGILNLIHLPELQTAYVFGAEVDTLVLQSLRRHLPEMSILEEEGTYY